jgi:hypothetical protein
MGFSISLYPRQERSYINNDLLFRLPNRLTQLQPEAARYADVVRVIDFPSESRRDVLRFTADALRQSVMGYLE